MTSNNSVRSIKRVFDIIESLVETPESQISTIARETDLPKSTVHSHLATLRELGLVQKSGSTYSATTKFLDYAGRQRKQMNIYQKSRRIVEELAISANGYADLYVEEDGIGVLLHLATGGLNIELGFAHEGLRQPLHTNASGRAILAFQPEAYVADVLDNYSQMKSVDPIDEDALINRLEAIRESKYTLDDEEGLAGMGGAGAPIRDKDGNAVAGIAVYKPIREMSETYFHNELPKLVQQKANIIEVNLNYN